MQKPSETTRLALSPRRRPPHLCAYSPTDRERHQLPPDAVPPAPENTHRLGEYVERLMRQLNLSERLWTAQLVEEWRALMGEALAAQTRPGGLEEGRLTVFVSHSMWLNELQRYSGRVVLSKMQERFGPHRIRSLTFKLDPGDSA